MTQNLWNERYSTEEYLFGKDPNDFFKHWIDGAPPQHLLLPAEGEGRNAVYAASKGWKVWAFDSSEVARKKALALAQSVQVQIRYDLMSLQGFHPGEVSFDAIGLIYCHLPSNLRREFHRQMQQYLSPGGHLVLEAFRKDQIHRQSGGPKDLDMLYSIDDLYHDFNLLTIEQLTAETVELTEGPGHSGLGEVVRYIGRK